MNKLQQEYNEKIKQEIFKEFKLNSIMEVPKILKVVINSGLKDSVTNPKAINDVVEEIGLITGQKPIITKAKKSIASFKLREGMPVGVKVTLRGKKMYEFLYKLFNIALPRVRDFRGLSNKAFDKQANYTLGVKEHIIFSEIDYDKINKIRGMDITIVTNTDNKEMAHSLLKKMGLPFKKKGAN